MRTRGTKTVIAVTPQSVTNGATVTGNIDTKGADFAEIDFILSGVNAATNNPSVLKVSESDDTVVTNFANVSGAVGDSDFTIPNMGTDTEASSVVKVRMNLTGRKRYLKVTATPITTQLIAVHAALSSLKQAPVNTTEANVTELVNVG